MHKPYFQFESIKKNRIRNNIDHIIFINPFLRVNQKFGVNLIMFEWATNREKCQELRKKEKKNLKKKKSELFSFNSVFNVCTEMKA